MTQLMANVLKVLIFAGRGSDEWPIYEHEYLVVDPDDTIHLEQYHGWTKDEVALTSRNQVLRMSEAWELLAQAKGRPAISESELAICKEIEARFEAKRSFP